MLSDPLTQLTYFFPWSLVIALLLAVVFAIVGIVIFKKATSKDDNDDTEDKASPLLEKMETLVARFGVMPTNSLSKSFANALKIMHAFIGGTQFRYQLPWFVMLGTSEAGKSTVLNSLDADRPIGRPHFEDEGGNKLLCDWCFYDHGIVLDLDGKLVLNPTQATSDEDNWQLFLNLLAHHRPKRPLDGVILTIPASEITGQSALSHDDLMVRAEYLYAKLWQMQRLTGMRVPVYLAVTKCDLVPGFESLCKSIPNHNKRDIFGWSNDQAVDSTYTTDWVDRAFSAINESLYRIQEEIYADAKTTEGRDGVFLFPLSFNQLKGGIRTYTDHIFKPSGYHESFFLRGIYFIGDSKVEREALELGASTDPSLSSSSDKEEKKRNLYFVDNLFENKIFREIGLARPVSRLLLGNTSAIRLAKVAVTAAAIVGTLGLLRANEKLQNAKLNLLPALTQVEVTLDKINGQTESTEIGRVFFDDQATVLLNTMTQISVNHLSSFFIPASWFDSLDSKISFVMGLAYDHVILRSMARELDYKAQELVTLDTIIPVIESAGNGVDPLETTEFYRLRNYIYAARALELAANEFNQLGMTSSLKDVADIIKYLFNYDMPDAFFENNAYYIDAIKQTKIDIFDFDSYRDNASIKLRKLFDEFQLASFNPNKTIPGLESLVTSLYNFSSARNYTAYDADILREVFVNLQTTINSIQNPGLQWLNIDHFNPGPQYEYVVSLMVGSNFFSNTATSDLLRDIDQNFTAFRQRLANYKSVLFSDGILFKAENGLAIASPSDGALELQDNLSSFFAEPFMAPTKDKTIITAIPIGSVLIWDTLRLQEAVNLVTTYNNFMNSRLLNLPKTLQPLLQKIGRESLTRNVVGIIADAEVFSSDISTGTSNAPEDSLLSQVQNYRVSGPYLEQLLISLKANSANSDFSTLKSLLNSQVYAPLEKLDNILDDEAPYAIRDNSFDWWKGENLAALEAFAVSNLTELKNYLELQRDRINYLAQEFAAPLVFLLQQINKEGMPGDLPLVTKWVSIINELDEYTRKAPGNGLVALESFIMGPLNEVTLATCPKYANLISALSVTEDFYTTILVDMQQKLHDRCVELSGYVSSDRYSHLSQFFNANLAGKFPFVEAGDWTCPDANPEDIRTFFEMMDTEGKDIKATLQQSTNLGPAGNNALVFIEQMEQVRKFFGGYLQPSSTLPTPAFSFDVKFRVNKGRESHANEILDWILTAADTPITMRSASSKGYWKTGDPIQVTFGWAHNSPLQPMMVEGSPNFDVQGENATFSYEGTWALLRLLRQQSASPSDFDSLNDEEPVTLRFEIPLTNAISNNAASMGNNARKATVFVRMQVSPLTKAPEKQQPTPAAGASGTPAPEKVQMGAPLPLPYFPYNAPNLNLPGT